jgi:hypothetical protein
VEKADPHVLLNAQYNSALHLPPDDSIISDAQESVARDAFSLITAGADPDRQREALMELQVPDAVKELVGMLTAYDWKFIKQAEELRGYVVAKITEETTHPDAKIRLKALELLGKVTEVHLFTERVEVKHPGLTDSELDEELKKRLDQYAKLEKEVLEGESEKIEEKIAEIPESAPAT